MISFKLERNNMNGPLFSWWDIFLYKGINDKISIKTKLICRLYDNGKFEVKSNIYAITKRDWKHLLDISKQDLIMSIFDKSYLEKYNAKSYET